jgi:hypothetical protein
MAFEISICSDAVRTVSVERVVPQPGAMSTATAKDAAAAIWTCTRCMGAVSQIVQQMEKCGHLASTSAHGGSRIIADWPVDPRAEAADSIAENRIAIAIRVSAAIESSDRNDDAT